MVDEGILRNQNPVSKILRSHWQRYSEGIMGSVSGIKRRCRRLSVTL